MNNNIYSKIIEKIINEQESIIGPIALEQAQKVSGLKLNWQKREIIIEGNQSDVVEKLIEQYKHLFGQTSVEACKQAVSGFLSELPHDQVPNLLR